jgi:hypothetical protein
MDESRPYFSITHPKDLQSLEKLSQTRCWDYQDFRTILVALGTIGNGQSLPAKNRPDSIHLQNWRKYIDDLMTRAAQSKREHSRSVFVDTQNRGLIMSGRIIVGSEFSTRIDDTPEPGREEYQKLIATIHTHPTHSTLSAHGFSDTDYITFLCDSRQQAMIIAFGQNIRMMVMKTTTTPNNLHEHRVRARINDALIDFVRPGQTHLFSDVITFNKAVCAEMGLIMLQADNRSKDLFNRVNVTT